MKKLYRKGAVHPTPPLVSDHLSFLPAAIFILTVALSQEDKEVLAYLIYRSSGDFSGNRRTTQKSRPPNSAPSTLVGGEKTVAAVHGGGCGVNNFSGQFLGNQRTTQNSTTADSASDNVSGNMITTQTSSAAVAGGADHLPTFNCVCFSCYKSYWEKWDSSPNRELIHEILDAYEDGLQIKKQKSKKEKRNKKKISNDSEASELKKSSNEPSLNKAGFRLGQADPVELTSDSRSDGGDDEEHGGDDEGTEKGSVRRFASFLGEKIWSVWT